MTEEILLVTLCTTIYAAIFTVILNVIEAKTNVFYPMVGTVYLKFFGWIIAFLCGGGTYLLIF